jgi:hypothetical protein
MAYNWQSDITDYATMAQLSHEFDNRVEQAASSYYKAVRGWLLFSALSLGVGMDELRTTPRDVMKRKLLKRQAAALDAYFKRLIAWEPEAAVGPEPLRLSPTIAPNVNVLRAQAAPVGLTLLPPVHKCME